MPRRHLKKTSFMNIVWKCPIVMSNYWMAKQQVQSQANRFKDKINQNLQWIVNLNWRFSNINCKEKETQHINLRTNQGYQSSHLEAKLGPYDLCFAPLNVSENQMVPMCNTQLDFICHDNGIHHFFIKVFGQTWLLFTCYLWGWIYSKIWSVKLETSFFVL